MALKQLVTIHDANFLHNSLHQAELIRKRHRFMLTVSPATHLSFISQYTASDVLGNFHITIPSKVILNGVSDLSRSSMDSTMILPSNYLFHISRMSFKKNVHLLVEMMRYMPEYNLVIAGYANNEYLNLLNGIIERHRLCNILIVGSVNEAQKIALYTQCRALLFPSSSEGFGLPVIEAMYFGKPVFCSRLTALPEIGGSAAFYFDSLLPKDMAEKVRKKLEAFSEDEITNRRLVRAHAERFNWNRATDEYIDYYRTILSTL